MKAERRIHPRFSIAQAIEAEFPKETIFEAEGLDISENGIRIETERKLETYAKIFIMIQTGESETDKFYFDGVVAWVKGAGKKYTYGINITDIDPGSLINMRHFIRTRE